MIAKPKVFVTKKSLKYKPKRVKRFLKTNISKNCKYFKIKAFLKLLFIIFCSTILLYQIIDQLKDYLRFDTIVMIDNESQDSQSKYPGVSFCRKFAMVEILTNNETKYISLPISTALDWISNGFITRDNDSLQLNLSSNSKVEDLLFGNNKTLLMTDLFEPIKASSIKCINLNVSPRNQCYSSLQSITSESQCLTFFSQISSKGVIERRVGQKVEGYESEEIVNNIAVFAINFTELNLDSQGVIRAEHFIIIDDPKGPPNPRLVENSWHRFRIQSNRNYELSFSKKTTVKLPRPYHTNCKYYDLDKDSTDIYSMTRDLCIAGCRNRRILKKYNCLLPSNDIIKGHTFSEGNICKPKTLLDMISNGSVYRTDRSSKRLCYAKCEPDCVQTAYDVELDELYRDYMSFFFRIEKNNPDMGYVLVLAKQFAETNHFHLPKMNLTDFLCNIGGLVSLWLGLSILSIYDYSSRIISSTITKIKFS